MQKIYIYKGRKNNIIVTDITFNSQLKEVSRNHCAIIYKKFEGINN